MQEVSLLQMLSNKKNGINLSESNLLKNSDSMGEVFNFAKLLFALTNGAKFDKAPPPKIMPYQKQSIESSKSLTNNILQSNKNDSNDADKVKFLHDYNQSQKESINNEQVVKTKDADESTKIVQNEDKQNTLSDSAKLQQQQNVKEGNEVKQAPGNSQEQKTDVTQTSADNVVKENSTAKEIVPLKEAVENVSAGEVKEDVNVDEETMLAILNQLIAVIEAIRKLLNVNVNNIEVQNTGEENSNLNIVQIVQQLNEISAKLDTLSAANSDLKQEVAQVVNSIKENILQLNPKLTTLLQTEVSKKEITSAYDLPEEQNANVEKNSSALKTETSQQPEEIPVEVRFIAQQTNTENNLLKEIALLLKDLQGVVQDLKTSQVQVSANQVEVQQQTQNNNEVLNQLQKVEDNVKNLLSENSVVIKTNNNENFAVADKNVNTAEVKVSSLNNELQIKTNSLNEENKTVVLNTNQKTDLNNLPLLENKSDDNIVQKVVSAVRNFTHEMKSGSGYDILLREQLVLNFSPNDKQAISLFLQNMQNLMQAGEIKPVSLSSTLQNDTQSNNGFDAQTTSGNNLLLGLKEPVNLRTASANFENIISAKASSTENIIENIVQGVRLVLSKDYGEMRIKLKPENLGEVTLKVMLEEGIVRASIQAQNQQVVSVLEKNISTLEERLKHQGIKLDEIIIQQYANNGSDFNSQQQLAEKNQQGTAQSKSFYFGSAEDEKENASALSLNTVSSYVDKLSSINFLA